MSKADTPSSTRRARSKTEERAAALSDAAPDSARSSKQSGLYRAVWRWHFYAGIFSIPVVIMLCLSGIVWLFAPQLNSALYGKMRDVTPGTSVVSFDEQRATVEAAYQESSISGIAPPAADDKATRFDLVTKDGKEYSVFVDPHTGKITGRRDNGRDPAKLALGLHGSMLTAKWPLVRSETWGDRVVEIAASWSVLLLISGIYLWWPRGKRNGLKGVLVPRFRERKGSRTVWRDVHAVTGILFAFVTIFFLVTGLMWAGVWGPQVYTRATNAIGAGVSPDDIAGESTKVEDLVTNGKAG